MGLRDRTPGPQRRTGRAKYGAADGPPFLFPSRRWDGGLLGLANRLDYDRAEDDCASDERCRARALAQGEPHPQRAEDDLEERDRKSVV